LTRVFAPRVVDREEYPREYTDGGLGIVIVNMAIDQNGNPGRFRLLQGGPGDLDKARRLLEKWHFLPGSKNGVPVAVEASIEIPRRLTDDAVAVADGIQ
jgi:Gram-negative bacterial TonB protein C-terminal